MWSNVGKKYAGLTDHPLHQKIDLGDPPDWSQCRFETEDDALVWYRSRLTSGYIGSADGEGWRYGYTFTCTHNTKE